jgi:hypothetical protein
MRDYESLELTIWAKRTKRLLGGKSSLDGMEDLPGLILADERP